MNKTIARIPTGLHIFLSESGTYSGTWIADTTRGNRTTLVGTRDELYEIGATLRTYADQIENRTLRVKDVGYNAQQLRKIAQRFPATTEPSRYSDGPTGHLATAQTPDEENDANPATTDDPPTGTRVRITNGPCACRTGTVQHDRGTVTNPNHEDHGRTYVAIKLDTEDYPGQSGLVRLFTDQLETITELTWAQLRFPRGTRIRATATGDRNHGRTATVLSPGIIDNPEHHNHGRTWVDVIFDDGDDDKIGMVFTSDLETLDEQGDPAQHLPAGTRVRIADGSYAGHTGTVTAKRGVVTNPKHRNYGRAYVYVELETGIGAVTRKFTDEISITGTRSQDASAPGPVTSDETPIGTHVRIHSGHYAGSTGTITGYGRGMINFPGSPDDGRVFTGVALSEDDTRNPRQVVRVFHDEMHATGAPVDKDSATPGTRVRVVSGDFKGRTGTVRGHEHRDQKIVTVYMDTELMILPEEEDAALSGPTPRDN